MLFGYLCAIIALLIQRNVLARRQYATGEGVRRRSLRSADPCASRGRPIAGRFAAALVPFAAVIVISFMRFNGPVLHYELSLDNFAQLLQRSYRPLINTLFLSISAALAATLIGVPIGYLLVRRRSRMSALLEIVATSPFAVAGTVLGIGLVLTYNSGPLNLLAIWPSWSSPTRCASCRFRRGRRAPSCSRSMPASRRPRSISVCRHSPRFCASRCR